MTGLLEKIKSEISDNRVMIFIKGTPEAPQCGFSAAVVEILNSMGVKYKAMNIFDDPAIKPTLASYSNWPTTPQVFIDGKFIGGCDIMKELHESGELQKILDG